MMPSVPLSAYAVMCLAVYPSPWSFWTERESAITNVRGDSRQEIFPDQKVFPGQSKIIMAGAQGSLEELCCHLPGGCLALGDGTRPLWRCCQSPGFACTLCGKTLPPGMGVCLRIKGKREKQGTREKGKGRGKGEGKIK